MRTARRGSLLGRRRPRALAVALAGALVLTACSAGPGEPSATPEEPDTSGVAATGDAEPSGPATTVRDLRNGDQLLTLRMPEAYEPASPTDRGHDDYRCFLLDPELEEDRFLTGTDVLPGTPDVVHHVILFRVPPERLAAAKRLDAQSEEPGWTCFGGAGVETEMTLDDAPWLGAWAPGGGGSRQRPGYGVPLEAGSRIVMQVHYNLHALEEGQPPDVSAARLRTSPADSGLSPVRTMLLPGPVELPCRPRHSDSPLCERDAALLDVKDRFGARAGGTADLLYLLCGGQPEPGPEQSCTRYVSAPTTVLGAAGHMHLLGRQISIEVNAGRPGERTLLDIDQWDFDDQGARRVEPVTLERGDTVTVTCRHSQELRDLLPAFEGEPDRYVVWGEGTTDEMCLGILQVTDG